MSNLAQSLMIGAIVFLVYASAFALIFPILLAKAVLSPKPSIQFSGWWWTTSQQQEHHYQHAQQQQHHHHHHHQLLHHEQHRESTTKRLRSGSRILSANTNKRPRLSSTNQLQPSLLQSPPPELPAVYHDHTSNDDKSPQSPPLPPLPPRPKIRIQRRSHALQKQCLVFEASAESDRRLILDYNAKIQLVAHNRLTTSEAAVVFGDTLWLAGLFK